MNKHCECKMAGYCSRHKINKTQREHAFCNGTADTKDCGIKYWNAWEQGKLGATKPGNPIINPDGFCNKKGPIQRPDQGSVSANESMPCKHLGEVVAKEPCTCGSHVTLDVYNCNSKLAKNKWCVASNYDHGRLKDQTAKSVIASCGDCVFKEVKIEPPGPFPFTKKPRITLLCHCWPNGGNWQKHIDYLKKTDGLYDRRIMAVATGPGTSSFDEVKKSFGPGWEYLELKNDPELHEVHTARIMFDMVQTTDPNDVTFYMHLKGVKDHTAPCDNVRWWTEAMYETVIYNTDGIISEMSNGASVVGSFRRMGKFFRTKHNWHFSGTFYAIRNARAFENGVPAFDDKFWGTESWPGRNFSLNESSCIFGDFAGHLYDPNPALKNALIEWKKQNENRT